MAGTIRFRIHVMSEIQETPYQAPAWRKALIVESRFVGILATLLLLSLDDGLRVFL